MKKNEPFPANELFNDISKIFGFAGKSQDELLKFVEDNVMKIINQYGYQKFDKSLPINFINIVESCLGKENENEYGLKLETKREPQQMIHTLLFNGKVYGVLEQKYMPFNFNKQAGPSLEQRLLGSLGDTHTFKIIKE